MKESTKTKVHSVGLITKPSEYDNASIIGKYFHFWMWRFFINNRRSNIKPEDLHRCPRTTNSSKIGTKLERLWDAHLKECELKNKKPSLFWPVVKLFGPFYLLISILIILAVNIYPIVISGLFLTIHFLCKTRTFFKFSNHYALVNC